ncbi:hypothetical protein GOP47_0012105 [Adiantum capillus-veneris]|uniref:Uncharacterized protein n=1 Tax=Adiantum capillus-veneris TaxID=13818 RepID=A0A9D4UQK7_ADICA|nr:hypothetical protein GOP47_0012105 [Adiantum capillus-veneris]
MQRGCLKNIFSHEQGGTIIVFVVLEHLAHDVNNLDLTTGMPILPKNEIINYVDIIRPISTINHAFLWFKAPSLDMKIAYEVSECMECSRLVHLGYPGWVPPWIEAGDHVLTLHEGLVFKEAIVRVVDSENRRARISWIDAQEESIGAD